MQCVVFLPYRTAATTTTTTTTTYSRYCFLVPPTTQPPIGRLCGPQPTRLQSHHLGPPQVLPALEALEAPADLVLDGPGVWVSGGAGRSTAGCGGYGVGTGGRSSCSPASHEHGPPASRADPKSSGHPRPPRPLPMAGRTSLLPPLAPPHPQHPPNPSPHLTMACGNCRSAARRMATGRGS